MGWTKRQLIDAAFTELGLGGYSFDASPEQLERALRRLDAMVANWDGIGVYIGYPLPGSPESSNLDAETNIPDFAAEAVFLNLALALAPSYGKVVDPLIRSEAQSTKNVIMARLVRPKPRRRSALPSGAGNKEFTDAFIGDSAEHLGTGSGGPLDFN